MVLFIILFVVFLFVYFKFLRKLKVPKCNSVTMVTGGVKCGKSTFAVNLVLKEYKLRLRAWKIKRFFAKFFHLKFDYEMPLLYSNVPLNCSYCPVTINHLLRKCRFNFGSVVYLQESSLVADSLLIKDSEINKQLQLFIKLFGHETHAGLLVLDTHTINDNHFSIKRGISEYFYIHHLRVFPFFMIAYIRELSYSDDNSNIVNVFNDDIEDSLKRVFIWKKVWKKFDSFSFSSFTDNLPVDNTIINNYGGNLKVKNLVSFRKEFNVVVDEKKECK